MLREQYVLAPDHCLIVTAVVVLQIELFLLREFNLLNVTVLKVRHLVAHGPKVNRRQLIYLECEQQSLLFINSCLVDRCQHK